MRSPTEFVSEIHGMKAPVFAPEVFRVHLGDRDVLDGQVVTASELERAPTLYWHGQCDRLYSVLMGQPGEPEDRNFFATYLMVNIPGTDMLKGEVLIHSYRPSRPIMNEYIVELFEQKNRLQVPEVRDPEWIDLERLRKLGMKKIASVKYFYSSGRPGGT